MPLLDGGGEDERLEGRARLPPRLREEVELVVRAARDDRRHRADRTARRVDETIAAAGSVVRVSVWLIAFCASCCQRGSIVV